ncbi:zinc ribbon-containing protein [Myxococcota bacterium]|nr:zinc ribbon-containing protein [Myxococcota bacterium]
METAHRYVTYELQTSCSHCGNPLMLNGPNRSTLCNDCTREVEIQPGVWKSLLEDGEKEYHQYTEGQGSSGTMMTGGFTFQYKMYRLAPRCPKCKKNLATDSVKAGTTTTITCPDCSNQIHSFPAPKWLTEVLPSAKQIFGTEPERVSEPQSSGELSMDSFSMNAKQAVESIKPVVMQCPQCGDALSISTTNERVTPCGSCGSDIFIPDPVWRRLHPVKTVEAWTVRFEGDTWQEINAREKELKKAEKERLRQEELSERSVGYRALLKKSVIPRVLVPLGGIGFNLYLLWTIYQKTFQLPLTWINPVPIVAAILFVSGFLWGLVTLGQAVKSMDKNFSMDWVFLFIPTMFPLIGVIWSVITLFETRSKMSFGGKRISNPLSAHLGVGYLNWHIAIILMFVAGAMA